MSWQDNRLSLLIADDDDCWRSTVREVFELSGFHTLTACNGREAVEIAQAEEVHCLLLDFQMPEMTGLEALRIVRSKKVLIPCVMISASVDGQLVSQTEILRIFSILSKPVTRELLTITVARALLDAYPERMSELWKGLRAIRGFVQ